MESLLVHLDSAQADMLRAIAAQSREGGVQAYLVGGAVRDWLLGASRIDDLDFSIDGDSVEFARALRAAHGGELAVHEKFRTARWIRHGASVDIAMSRAEEYARPAALPSVRPAPIEVDLGRRDFAVNAIALRLSDAQIVDPFDGCGDLDRRLLRGLHEHSFVDDPTRMLRGARYAARLGFAFTDPTLAAIRRGVPHLRALSGERIKYDIELIFQDRRPAEALTMLRDLGAFAALGAPTPDSEKLARRFTRIVDALTNDASDAFDVASLAASEERLLNVAGWGALTYAIGQLAAARWLEVVAFEHEVREALVSLGALSTLSAPLFAAPPSRCSAMLREFSGPALFIGWLFDAAPGKRDAMRSEWNAWRRVRPFLGGEDLRARGVPPGPRYKRILDALRDRRLDGVISSRADEERELSRILADE
jgi:tRNA nucleotidyltransferase (CCA-adding enzyme)